MTKKKKISMEFEINSSPSLLYNYLSSPSGLSEWFAHDVNVQNHTYFFKWEDSEAKAEMVKNSQNKYIRFRWEGAQEEEYFEFEIRQDELTDDVALVITDYVLDDEKDQMLRLWDNQVHDLKAALGA